MQNFFFCTLKRIEPKRKLKDGAILPSLHFSPGGVERVENAFQSFFVIKETEHQTNH